MEPFQVKPDDWLDGNCMVLQASWHDSFRDSIVERDVVSLRLSQSMGWAESRIDFVQELPLRGIEIYSSNVKDISPLAQISTLEHVGIDCPFRNPPDFSRFENLRICFLRWRKGMESLLSNASIEHLNVVGYPFQDFAPAQRLKRLVELKVTSRKLNSLDGIRHFEKLRTLDLHQCPHLTSLAGIESAGALAKVEIDGCRAIEDISPIARLARLRSLRINGCSRIESLSPLKACQKLEEFGFLGNTVIDDGDLSVLCQLPELTGIWFAPRRHYSHTREEVENVIAKRA